MQAAVLGSSADTLPGLFDGGVRKTYNIKARQAIGNIAFGYHRAALDAVDAEGMYTTDHKMPLFSHFGLL